MPSKSTRRKSKNGYSTHNKAIRGLNSDDTPTNHRSRSESNLNMEYSTTQTETQMTTTHTHSKSTQMWLYRSASQSHHKKKHKRRKRHKKHKRQSKQSKAKLCIFLSFLISFALLFVECALIFKYLSLDSQNRAPFQSFDIYAKEGKFGEINPEILYNFNFEATVAVTLKLTELRLF